MPIGVEDVLREQLAERFARRSTDDSGRVGEPVAVIPVGIARRIVRGVGEDAWRAVIGPRPKRSRNSGEYFTMGSSRSSVPCSTS